MLINVGVGVTFVNDVVFDGVSVSDGLKVRDDDTERVSDAEWLLTELAVRDDVSLAVKEREAVSVGVGVGGGVMVALREDDITLVTDFDVDALPEADSVELFVKVSS